MRAIPETTTFAGTAKRWKDGEYLYCRAVVGFKGNSEVGRAPAGIASYLRLQAYSALRDREYEISARLLASAAYLAGENAAPHWERAYEFLTPGQE